MYEAYFNLKERPFSISPDPRFFYLTAQHREALTNCQYMITNRVGPVVSGHRGGKGANLAKIGSAADCPNVAAGHQSSYLTSSADHLVCQYQERRRKCNPEGLSRLHVEDQLEFRGLLHGQVRRLGTLQHSVHIDRSTPEEVHITRCIRHETPGIDKLPVGIHAWQATRRGKVHDLLAVTIDEPVGQHDQRVSAVPGRSVKGTGEIRRASYLQGLELQAQRAGRRLCLVPIQHLNRIRGIPEHGHACEGGHSFLEQLEPFRG